MRGGRGGVQSGFWPGVGVGVSLLKSDSDSELCLFHL